MADELVKIDPVKFTDNEIALIKRTVAEGATDDELALFLYQARRTQLDPLARQIHFVKRGGKATIQTGIDGYRLVADRSGKYAGNDNPVYEGEAEFGQGNDAGAAPLKATVTVWKMVAGQRVGFSATAYWYEYYPGDTGAGFMWRKMPCLMLGKVAESLALRKAFPAELSGVYTQEEMAQADREDDRQTGGMAPAIPYKPADDAATGRVDVGNGKSAAPAGFVQALESVTPGMTAAGRKTLVNEVGRELYKTKWVNAWADYPRTTEGPLNQEQIDGLLVTVEDRAKKEK